jgi:hypothetical protein
MLGSWRCSLFLGLVFLFLEEGFFLPCVFGAHTTANSERPRHRYFRESLGRLAQQSLLGASVLFRR